MEFQEIRDLIWNNKIEDIKSLVNENVDYYINLEDDSNKTLLSYASSYGKFEIVKFLVEKGANINHQDSYGNPMIFLATHNTSLDIIEYLLEFGADVNVIPRYENSGLIGELSREPEATSLIKKIVDKADAIDKRDLIRVFNRQNIEIAKYIIENKGVSSEIIVDSITDFIWGVANNTDKIIEFFDYLFDNKYVDINDKSSFAETMFILVVKAVNSALVPKYMIEKGVDLDLDNNKENGLLIMAGKGDDIDGVKLFLEHGADINYINSVNQNALHYETMRYVGYKSKETELPKKLEYLVKNGIDITLMNNYGKLAIHFLQDNKRTVSIKYLFDKTVKAILAKKGLENDEDLFNKLFSIQELASNKQEKELLIDALTSFPEFSDRFTAQLDSSKLKLRDLAVKVLIRIDDDKNLELLRNRSEVESNKTLLKVLNKYLATKKDKVKEVKKELKAPNDYKKNSIEWFEAVAENDNTNVPISWLKVNELPEVLWKNEKIMDIKTLKYFLKLLKNNKLNKKFLNLINSYSLIELFDILHNMPKKINKDDMWIFNILFMLAEEDSKYIDKISDEIQWFVNRYRWAMGAKLLLPLAQIKNIDGLKKVDWYARKFKHKGIKNDALYALKYVASQKGLTVDELKDSLISDFGFNKNKELTLDYGTRKIIVKLMPDFKYTFKDETGKTFKTLPKASKKDNEKMANASIKFFKSMKKEIKDIIKVQKEKLEEQFKALSLKDFSYWKNLYVKNPILNIFAQNLFWGVYENSKLKLIFRYNEDHSFTDINDDEITLNPKDKIGLIHPLELKEIELNKLKELIDDYEIIQALEQVERKFFTTNSKSKKLNDFKDLKFYPKSTHYKLLKLGWERGYIVDNGFFENYFMRVEKTNSTANLEFSGVDMYLEYNIDKPITWGAVEFNNGIPLKSVDKRFYSEVYRTLDIVAQTKVEE